MRTCAPIVLLTLTLALSASFCAAAINQQAIDAVAAGQLREARASWWGYDPAEATACLQAAIDSGVPRLIVDNVGTPWIVDPIVLGSDQAIIFEDGVEVLAKADSFKGKTDALFRADLKENITLSGYGATLRMRRDDYDSAAYERAEWRHVLSFKSCTNVKVYGLVLAESGGDGIYLGTSRDSIPNTDVHIKDVICDRNYRQGISVINAENLLIENTVMQYTAGTAPQAGIDFEPNRPGERLVNCVMRNCTTRGNRSNGFVLYLRPMDATSRPISVRLENCTSIEDGAGGFGFITGNRGDAAVTGTMVFDRCVVRRSASAGFLISDNPTHGCAITVKDCVIENAAADSPLQAPIMFMSRSGAADPVGNVVFSNVVVRDRLDRAPMQYVDGGGGVPLGGISGELIVVQKGNRETIALTHDVLANWMPQIAIKQIPHVDISGMEFRPVADIPPTDTGAIRLARFRNAANLIAYATKGDTVEFTVRHGQVGKYAGSPVAVKVTSPSGESVLDTSGEAFTDTPMSFTAPTTGIYHIRIDAGANWGQVADSSHPMLLSSAGQAIRLYLSPGDYYIWVPEKTADFGVRVFGEGMGEGVKATLIDPAGTVFEQVDNMAQTHQFEVSLPPGAQGQVWTLRLERPSQMAMEDHYVDIRGIPPLLAPSEGALLKPVK